MSASSTTRGAGSAAASARPAFGGVILSPRPMITVDGHVTAAAASAAPSYAMHARKSLASTPGALCSTSARAPPSIHRPGVGFRPTCAGFAWPHAAISAAAAGRSVSAAARRSGCTGIPVAVAHSVIDRVMAGCRRATSSAMNVPIEWPTRCTEPNPAASTNRRTQSAISSIDPRTSPPLRPWSGRSTATARNPRWARYRVCRLHAVASLPAPWISTTTGSSPSRPTPPVAACASCPSTETIIVGSPSALGPDLR